MYKNNGSGREYLIVLVSTDVNISHRITTEITLFREMGIGRWEIEWEEVFSLHIILYFLKLEVCRCMKYSSQKNLFKKNFRVLSCILRNHEK
jgi:hypothetical protein